MLLIQFNKKFIMDIELIFLFLKSLFFKLINNILFIILKYISDKYFVFVKNEIKYDSVYDVSDSNSEDIIEPTEIPIEYTNILNKLNVNNIINKYSKNTNKKKMYDDNSFYIINSFLFNFKENCMTDKDIFTKKLIILFNRFNYINIKHIFDINDGYKYLYIFYKNDENKYNVKIIDMLNGIELVSNSEILFNIIHL